MPSALVSINCTYSSRLAVADEWLKMLVLLVAEAVPAGLLVGAAVAALAEEGGALVVEEAPVVGR